ncbi:hypothetical protein SARC_12730, partial [Sphaeroforma arctica JP610]
MDSYLPVLITHSGSAARVERSFKEELTVGELKNKLELITGVQTTSDGVDYLPAKFPASTPNGSVAFDLTELAKVVQWVKVKLQSTRFDGDLGRVSTGISARPEYIQPEYTVMPEPIVDR